MSIRVDAGFAQELKKFGKGDWNECYHCGNCTANCPLTEQGILFPRKEIRALQMGLKETVAMYTEPWMCYYCGDCSTNCPRNANPGELMMTLRRYLTSVYDWTGLSKKFYTSKVWEIGAIIVLALTVLGLWFWKTTPPEAGAFFPDGVPINRFAPVEVIHLGDWIMAGALVVFLVSNIFNMYYKIILKDKTVKISLATYITQFWSLIWHFGTQAKLSKCDTKTYWGAHWFLMSGYVILFTMIVIFLPWFQTDNVYSWYHPQRILGYYATIGLFVGIVYFTVNRIQKMKEHSKYSHVTDWTFLVLLFFTTLTGILLHLFRIYGYAGAMYYTYLIHLMVLVPMLMIEVPFSKWSHLAYRPFAIYFANLKKASMIKNLSMN
jgi:heterodisulfide reductase subunit C